MERNYDIVGDVHRKILLFEDIVRRSTANRIVQLGDFGYKSDYEWLAENCDPDRVKIIQGNHDYYLAKNLPHVLGNYSFLDELIFTVRGADSRDKRMLKENWTWFAEEQLTYREGMEAYDAYLQAKPEIVVTHEAPSIVKKQVYGYDDKTITDQLLQGMFEEHQPAIWIHGHHHRHHETVIEGTLFICLEELEVYHL